MERLAQLLARHRLGVCLFISGLTATSLYGISQLQFDDDPRNILRTGGGRVDYVELEAQFREFGSDDTGCVLVIEGPDLFTRQVVAVLRQLVDAVRRVEGIQRVRSIFDARRPGLGRVQIPLVPGPHAPDSAYGALRARALNHPLVVGQLVSPDGGTMLVLAELEHVALHDSEPAVARLRQVVEQFDGREGLRVRLTGVPAVRAEIIRNVQRDAIKFNVLGCMLALAIALVVFRQPSAVLIAVAAPELGVLWVLGAMGLAGVQINVLNSVVPTLVVVVGLTDSIHFLLDIQRSRAAHLPGAQASAAAIEHVGGACGLTSLTSAVGFGSLAVAKAEIIREFGLACAAGSILTFIAVLTVVPLLASTRLSRNLGAHRERQHVLAGWSNAVVRLATTYPLRITAVGAAVTVILGIVATGLKPDSWLAENLPAGGASAEALRHCDDAFGGLMFAYASIEWPQNESLASENVHGALLDVRRMFRDHPETRHPLSVLNVVEALPLQGRSWAASVRYLERGEESLENLLRIDRRHALVSAHVRDIGAARFEAVFDDLKRQLADIEARHPGLTLRMTGTSVVSARHLTQMIRDLGNSLGLESLVIFTLMAWCFRSFGLGLISIIPNVFPLVCVGALMIALGMPLQFGSVIVFNICLGLAVDDTIHVMTRFNRELAIDHDVRAAIRRSFAAVGTAMLTSTAILLAGFAVVTLSDVPALQLFGGLSCVTIMAALVGELLLTPALLLTFLRRKYPGRSPAVDMPEAVIAATPVNL